MCCSILLIETNKQWTTKAMTDINLSLEVLEAESIELIDIDLDQYLIDSNDTETVELIDLDQYLL